MLTMYSCGHVGKENDGPNAKATAFIRVAEIRDHRVTEKTVACPDCQAG